MAHSFRTRNDQDRLQGSTNTFAKPSAKAAVPEFCREVQPPASLKGLDIPSRRAVFVPWKPSRRPAFGMETRLFVEEPMLSTELHFASESTVCALPTSIAWH